MNGLCLPEKWKWANYEQTPLCKIREICRGESRQISPVSVTPHAIYKSHSVQVYSLKMRRRHAFIFHFILNERLLASFTVCQTALSTWFYFQPASLFLYTRENGKTAPRGYGAVQFILIENTLQVGENTSYPRRHRRS